MNKKIVVSKKETGQRLDIFCVSHIPNLSRSALQRAIKEGLVTVNKKKTKPRYLVRADDAIAVSLPDLEHTSSLFPTPPPTNPPIPIIYEDENIAVINKLPGLLVHPAYSHSIEPTISSWFTNKYSQAQNVGEGQHRGGIVHRLDLDTSGALVLAKNQDAYEFLKKQFKKRRIKKEYLALVFGIPRAKEGRINRSLSRSRRNPSRRTVHPGGKPAITEWKIDKKLGRNYALLRVFPYTGRTHQIRVHLHFIGHPIVGDPLYIFKRQTSPSGITRQMLHAEKLTLALPTGKRKTFTAPLPPDYATVLDNLS